MRINRGKDIRHLVHSGYLLMVTTFIIVILITQYDLKDSYESVVQNPSYLMITAEMSTSKSRTKSGEIINTSVGLGNETLVLLF